MRFSPFTLLGLAFFALAFFGGLRVRREIESGVARWLSSLFQNSAAIHRAESPLRYWLAVVVNTLFVLLFALVSAFAMRVGFLRLVR
jgi:hypothetical protein